MTGAGGQSCRRFVVTGRVQGVFFRACTREEAERLGIRGWARNCADGSVEVVAAGSAEAIAELGRWLWRGSPSAEVTGVEVGVFEDEVGTSFATR